MKDKAYCDIITFFEDKNDRTIESLAANYKNRDLIRSSIERLLSPHFSKENVKNKRVLLKPNLVWEWQKPVDEICLCTHESVILETLEFFLRLAPKSVIIGDAPIQAAKWDKILTAGFHNELKTIEEKYGIPISLLDFRRVTFDQHTNVVENDRSSLDNYIIFDVGDKSYLEDVTSGKNNIRVTDYDPRRMAQAHQKGMHKYCIRREVIESDIVVTIPKTKTHRMAGITNSLKILVGINGDKDYLPHHRLGPVSCGGDCYKKYSPLRSLSETLMDMANKNRGGVLYRPLYYGAKIVFKLSFPDKATNGHGGWYGNDTVWRMVYDLNLIAKYGCPDGTLSNIPQRTMYTLCDGIIGGQGDGPLNPSPLALGTLTFSNDPYLSDEVAGHLFHLKLDRIPSLREAAELNKEKECSIMINGVESSFKEVDSIGTDVQMSGGWVNYDK